MQVLMFPHLHGVGFMVVKVSSWTMSESAHDIARSFFLYVFSLQGFEVQELLNPSQLNSFCKGAQFHPCSSWLKVHI